MHRHLRYLLTLTGIASLLLLVVSSGYANSPDYEIRFATIAPEGTTWMTIMHRMDNELREATDNNVGFRIYPGGVQGDEMDVIRKMRFNQIQAAGFTGNGLGEINPEFRVLDLPFMFQSKEEVDYITELFYSRIDSSFRERGYVLLGFTEVGYIYLFSRDPINSFDDLQSMRIWSWSGDLLANTMFEELGVTPVSLGLHEVIISLQTGMIDVVYCAPLAALSMQWNTRVSYMNLYPITNSNGAVLMVKSMFDRMPEEYQQALLEISRRNLRELTLSSREDNAAAIEQMEDSGLTLLAGPDNEEQEHLRIVGQNVRTRLSGNLYTADLLTDVEAALLEFRAGRMESN